MKKSAKMRVKYWTSSICLLLAFAFLSHFILAALPPVQPGNGPEVPGSETLENIQDSGFEFLDETKDYNLVQNFNVSVTTDKQLGMTGYETAEATVRLETGVDATAITDTIAVNDKIELERIYYEGDMLLDSVYAEFFEIEIDYDLQNRPSVVYYYSDIYDYIYNEQGLLESVYFNEELLREYEYNAQGRLVSENVNGNRKTYSYQGDYLYTINESPVYADREISGNQAEVNEIIYQWDDEGMLIGYVTGDQTVTLTYSYEYEGQRFLTAKSVDGNTTTYSYIQDKVVSIEGHDFRLDYILDNDFNYLGVLYAGETYYFAPDVLNHYVGLLNRDGDFVVKYSVDSWGNLLSTEGDLADTLGRLNQILFQDRIYDPWSNIYYAGDSIYDPQVGILLNSEQNDYLKLTAEKSECEKEVGAIFKRSAVSKFAAIHDKVVDVVVQNLQDQGLDVTGHLYVTDSNGNNKRSGDVYTLDYSITPFSAMNLFHGNQLYEVMYNPNRDGETTENTWQDRAKDKLDSIIGKFDDERNLFVSYFAQYKPTQGTLFFEGQFVYLNYLIEYRCDGEGIVGYQVFQNDKRAYNKAYNIYDYDNHKYVNYVNNTFDLNYLDGITIAPGLSQESFDIVSDYLTELQGTAGIVIDQMLIYDDPTYYDTVNANVTKDYWAQMNIPEGQYLTLGSDGQIKIDIIPVDETEAFWSKLAIGAGVILVTSIFATITVMIPGGCVVSSIAIGMFKGAVAGAVSGFAWGFVAGGAGSVVTDIVNGNQVNWEKAFDQALNGAADGFMSGAITGAIVGGLNGALKPSACFKAGTLVASAAGLVAIDEISVGDLVWSYDYKTDAKELKLVTATSVKTTDEVLKIKAGGEVIETTPEHPFYVLGQGYTAAALLRAGDRLQRLNGGFVVVEQIQHELLEVPIEVYNFTVEDNHSYYVGEYGIGVHNAGCKAVTGKAKADGVSQAEADLPVQRFLASDIKTSIGKKKSHVIKRHGSQRGQFVEVTKAIKSGREIPDVFKNDDMIIDIIEEGIKKNLTCVEKRPFPNSEKIYYRYDVDMGYQIGSEGQTILAIVLDLAGNFITSYPVGRSFF